MDETPRPEDLLRQARAEARLFFEHYDAELQAIETALKADHEPAKPLLDRDYLSLFLRSLNSELMHALDEVRSSSERLAHLAQSLREHQ